MAGGEARMSQPFLSEIKMMSFNFAPKGWAMCNGQLLPINQNQALFSLLGTTYGGDGRVTFGIPNLQGRVPIHSGSGHTLGEIGGETNHTLTISELTTHNHNLNGTTLAADLPTVPTNLLATVANVYTGASSLTSMNPASLAMTGGNQAHPNQQPYLTLNFCIALQGIFPSQN
jgi:microcystin-dependent protein